MVVYLFMKWILPAMLPFFAAIYLAGWIYPWKQKLQMRGKDQSDTGKRRGISFLMSAGTVFAAGVAIYFLVKVFLQQLMRLWQNRSQLLSWEGVSRDSVLGKVMARLQEAMSADQMAEGIISSVMDSLQSVTDTLGGMVSIVVVFVATYLILKDYDMLRDKVRQSAFGEVLIALGKDLGAAGGGYLKAQGKIMLAVTGICVVVLFGMGNPYALVLGILIGICDALPFVGTALIFVPWALFKFLQGEYLAGMVYLAVAAATALVRQFLEPKLIGKSVGANPLAVLVSIYLGIQVYGGWGVVLGPASAFLIWEIYRFL